MSTWKATLENGIVIESNDLIFHNIKDKLDSLTKLSLVVNDEEFSLLYKTGKFVLRDKEFTIHNPERLKHLRPICFRREKVTLDINSSNQAKAETTSYGLGFQGKDRNGNNVKAFLLVDSDGNYKVET